MNSTPAIDIERLTKTYGSGARPAVDDVSLRIQPGTVFGFLGPNGAGKTTTIKIAAGLLAASAGTVRLNGYDVAARRSAAMAQIGAVLEGSRNVYWTLTAWQNLIYFGRLKGLRKAEARGQATELLTDLGLWDRRHDRVGDFSRGMQQKVAIAAALIADPPIVLLDEPTLGLDVAATRTVRNWIATLSEDRGKTILLTTHQLDVVAELCDRVAVIREGTIVADQATGELLSRFRRRDSYEVHIEGVPALPPLPGGFTAEESGDSTVIAGRVDDPRVVYQLLERLGERGIVLRSLAQAQPSLEDVFLSLVEEPAHV
ncbi:ABC transporter ATP-binding protein [Stackebrandtia nassauensis]|uniref:ABC transporter related protein n=1 Tax=Stackebrandtia nassauensis (strain DSM 44728 / CIP 108903 / NRRL B-16338 / NBRC 102104 / LLR-40K-21) TaxID=446470 RepID=D3Q6B6_STANL|nr:ABC transporter ATP-binding protein [Stackebrandtia nassauensis]ADD42291.1 ABC transporter related protein [Stackebrandtia nassauensis DSM 44728]